MSLGSEIGHLKAGAQERLQGDGGGALGGALYAWHCYLGNTRTATGLRVQAQLDERAYPTGETVTNAQMRALSPKRDDFHGDWNYELQPRTKAHKPRGAQSLKLPPTKLAS